MAVQRDKIIASAEKLVAKGKVEAAIKEYERLLDDNPNDVNTLNRIGDLWVRINRNDEAVKVFGRIADHYSKDGFFLKAIAIYKKINKLDPSKLDVYAKLADLYAKQGLAMEAKSQYQVLADYYTKHGDPANALATFRKISELDPNSINVHVKLADLYSQNNQTAEALKEYDRVGRMLLKRGMLDEAVQVFRKALKIDATNLELVESLTTALFDAKDFENAAKILETSLEKNRENPRLLSLLGRAFIGRGDMVGATDVLERGLYSNPTDASIRDSLAEVYLRQGAVDRAFDLIVPLIDSALSRGEGKAAVDLVNRVLKLDPHNIPALHKLVSVHTKLKQETSILSAMNNLAEAHIAERQYADAATVLNDLLQREPENAQHREKLALVQQRLGGAAAAPQPAAAPRPAQAPRTQPAPVAPPPPAPPAIVEEQPEDLSIDLDSSSALELDLSFMPEPAAKPEPLRHAPSPRSISDAFAIPTPEMEEEEEDLDFITEHLTEAEVFAKYGLSEKAIEHCRAVLDRFPKNLAGHEKLLRVYLDEGDAEQARKVSDRYLQLLDEAGDSATAAAVRNELVERGYLEPAVDESSFTAGMEEASELAGAGLVDVETISPAVESFMNPVAGVEPEPEEVTLDFATEVEEVAEIEFDIEEATLAEEVSVTPSVEEPLPEETFEMPSVEESFDLPEMTAESLEVGETPVTPEFDLTESIPLEETPATPEPEFEMPKDISLPELDFVPPEEPLEFEAMSDNALEFDLTTEEPAFEAPAIEIPEPESVAESLPADAFDLAAEVPELSVSEPSFSGAGIGSLEPEPEFGEADFTSPAAVDPAPEELGEIDFYVAQELYEEARKRVDALAQRFPASQEIAVRRAQIERAPAPAAPTDLSADLIESELLTALPEEDDIHIISAPRAPQPVVPAVDESNLFAEEDDFFDLAAELEEELEQEEATVSLSDEEQSLEEIFREFKKGVEQQLDSEDYDTHYNLGIAYKEMGLIDEAIGEFQLASKDPKRTIECCSMLGLCFLEKGMPQLAIKWYGKGLEVPEISEDEHLGLLYDLALVYLEVGDVTSAQKAFVEIYGMNSNYRDVVNRIKQLEDVRN